jgi:hypothetical protein
MDKEPTRYKLREQEGDALAIIWVENGGEGGNTMHPTQPNPRQHEPLDGKVGFIHGS